MQQHSFHRKPIIFTLLVATAVLAAVTCEKLAIAEAARHIFHTTTAVPRAAMMQATNCAPPNLQLTKQLTLDANAGHLFVAGDFNSDGKQDLVVQTSVGKLYTLLGDGAGNFANPTTLFLPTGGLPEQIGTGDFNGDGKLDVVTLAADRLRLYPGDGTGRLAIGTQYTLNASGFQLGDFNKDGKTDIAVALRCCPDGIVIYLSDASGHTPTNFPWGSARVSAVADFNSDGNLDILTSDNYYPSSRVRLGNGRGQFTNGDYLYYNVQVFYFATTDFNQDGKVDVLGYTAQNRVGQDEANSRKLIVLSGDGAGRFTASYPAAPLDAIPFQSFAADYNGDGFPDIATPATSLFLNNGGGNLCTAFPLSSTTANKLGAADFNGDGSADLIRQVNGDKLEIWSRGSGPVNTPPTITGTSSELTQGLLADDFSRITTIATVQDAETPAGSLQIATRNLPGWITFNRLFNENGNILANFTIGCGAPIGITEIQLTVTDAGGLATTGSWRVNIVANNPPGPVRYRDVLVNGAGVELYPSAGWFDDSLRVPDLQVSAPGYGGSLTIDQAKNYPNNGAIRITNNLIPGRYQTIVTARDNCGATTTSTFFFTIPAAPLACEERQMSFALPLTNYGVGSGVAAVVTGDFNKDGKIDVASANFFSDNVSVLLGSGDGKFGATTYFPVGKEPSALGTGDFNGDGRLDLAVSNRGADNVTILLGNGAGGFSSSSNFAVGRNPQSLSIGDFNKDNKLDLVVANVNANTVSVLLGNGLGGFSSATNFTVGSNPTAVVVGDFNKDGRDDLAVTNVNSHNVSILLGTGTGGFNVPTNYPVGSNPQAGSSPNSVTTGDFNSDGNLDLAVPALNSNEVSVLLGNGSGGFGAALNFAVGSLPYSIAAADFNSDGKLDLVCSNVYSNNVSILLGNGRGGFSTASQFGLLDRPGVIAVGDFDGNQKPDLVAGYSFASYVSILQNFSSCSTNTPPVILGTVSSVSVPQGTNVLRVPAFEANDAQTPTNRLTTSVVSAPFGITVTKIELTGSTVSPNLFDVILNVDCAARSGAVVVRMTDEGGLSTEASFPVTVTGNTSPVLGTYANTTVSGASAQIVPSRSPSDNGSLFALTVTAPTYTGSLTIAPDGVVTINSNNVAGTHTATVTARDNCDTSTSTTFTFTIVPSNCNGQVPGFAAPVTYLTGGSLFDLETADFNNDGILDVASVNSEAITLSVLLGNGSGGFLPVKQNGLPRADGKLAVGDLNRDGKLDVVTATSGNNTVSVLIGKGTGDFNLAEQYAAGGDNPYDVAVADFNGDGRLDVIAAVVDGITLLLGDGTGKLGTPTKFALPSSAGGTTLAVADLNRDGRLDVVATSQQANKVSILLGNGTGGFRLAADYPVEIPYQVKTGDLNGDGVPDLAMLGTNGNLGSRLAVQLGRGDGTFGAATSYFVPATMLDLVMTDLNGDGRLDVVATVSEVTNNLAIFLGTGTGSFLPLSYANTGSFVGSITAADFDKDGRVDLAVTHFNFPNSGLKVLRNLGGCTTGGNTLPTITLFDVSWQQADPSGLLLDFGFVRDAETLWKDLKLDVVSAPPGVFVTNPFSNDGSVRATIRVDCSATLGVNVVKLRVTDGGGLSATADWRLTVTANPAPELGNYPTAPQVALGQSLILQPSIPLRDNSAIAPTITATAPTFQGTITVDGQGNVTVSNARPFGNHVFTVTATDDCGARIVRTFTLTVVSDQGAGCSTPTFNAPVSYAANNDPYGLTSGDFNGDGKADLATTNIYDNTVTVLLATASGYAKQTPIPVGVLPNYLATRDLNADGKLDLAVVNRGSDTVTILLGNSNGTFTKKGDYQVGNKSTGVAIGDFNRDGKFDLAVTNDGLGNVAILNGNGDGSFTAPRYLFAGDSPQPGIVGDFNKDNVPDLAFPNYRSGNVVVLLGLAFGGFNGALVFNTNMGSGLETIATGDLDGDGNPDLALTNTTTNVVTMLRGDGRGMFLPGGGFGTFSDYPASLVIADFTGDGKADIAVGGYNNDSVHVFKGLGNGFDNNTPTVIRVGTRPLSLLTNDFNGDGKPDLAVANNGSGTVSVLLNGCAR